MPRPRPAGWLEALQKHDDAAAALVATASRIDAAQWTMPRAPGQWSPAEIVEHLILGYQILIRELREGQGMALRTRPWQRLLLFLTVRRSILAGKPFPRGARAPRELRPTIPDEAPEATLRRLREAADALASAAREVHSHDPRRRLTHAYFGKRPLQEALRLCTAHVLHHERQLAGIAAGSAGR